MDCNGSAGSWSIEPNANTLSKIKAKYLPATIVLALIGLCAVIFSPGLALADNQSISGNLTLSGDVNVSATGDLTVSASNIEALLSTYADNASARIQTAILACVTAGITALAYWKRELILYALSGFSLVLFGLYFTDTSMGFGIIIALTGGYSFWNAYQARS